MSADVRGKVDGYWGVKTGGQRVLIRLRHVLQSWALIVGISAWLASCTLLVLIHSTWLVPSISSHERFVFESRSLGKG